MSDEEAFRMPCPRHSKNGRPANHSLGRCVDLNRWKNNEVQRALQGSNRSGGPGTGGNPAAGPLIGANTVPTGNPGQNQNTSNQGGFSQQPRQLGQYHIVTSGTTKRERKIVKREVNTVAAGVPRCLRWSEHTITWSRADHLEVVEHPGLLALVVAPQVGGFELKKVLMDSGSSINILFWDTFIRMGLKESQLQRTSTVFHGIVPGKSATPEGKISLEVAFGESIHNFRSEWLTFEVVKLPSPYHALFGRPAYAKFMARPCYVYLQLKIPGPKGIITVHGNREIAAECDEGDAALAEQTCAKEELKAYRSNLDSQDNTALNRPTTEDDRAKFKAAKDTKMVDFVPGDSSKQFAIGSNLSDK